MSMELGDVVHGLFWLVVLAASFHPALINGACSATRRASR